MTLRSIKPDVAKESSFKKILEWMESVHSRISTQKKHTVTIISSEFDYNFIFLFIEMNN